MKIEDKYTVILFYKFIDIADPSAVVDLHNEKAKELGLKGRILVAKEGINATLEGIDENIIEYKRFLHSDSRFSDILVKESEGNGHSFSKLSVKERDEAVTLGIGKFDIKSETAKKLTATELENWYNNEEDFVVLDLRNDYEIACGKLDKTIDPGLSNFRDLPDKLPQLKNIKDKKVLTVCTGGIRCEKATCLLKREGFSDIYQLKDGIHAYIQKNPGKHFRGTLFVFDNRMTTDVVETNNKEVIGRCRYCDKPTENYCCDDSIRPSKKFLCCQVCFLNQSDNIRQSSAFIN